MTTITNYTDSSRNDNPIDGDFIKITHSNGDYEKKTFWSSPVTVLGTEAEETQKYLENESRYWRNLELQQTDFIVPLSDYPNRDAWLTYRQELRDWTDTSDFPETKPSKP